MALFVLPDLTEFVIICPVSQTGFAIKEVPQGKRFINCLDLTVGAGKLTRLSSYLVMVVVFLMPISVVAAAYGDEAASKEVSPEVALYAKHVEQSDAPVERDKVQDLPYDDTAKLPEKPDSREMSLMIGLFARHVSQSDNPNEDLRMVVASYDNYVVSRYINSWDDPTYFGGKRFSTNKYPFNESGNLFYQGNVYAGILYGYGNNAAIDLKGIAPAIFPTVGLGYKTTSLEMGYIPTPSGGVFLSLFKYEF